VNRRLSLENSGFCQLCRKATLPNVTLTLHSAEPTVDSYHKRFGDGYANIECVARRRAPLWIIPEMRDLFLADHRSVAMAESGRE